ncbi:MAG: response regulator transcription factor [Deltaproteobacteria bacterium]|nr:response regulator transcription factor [Deltaproteobacteria bacterium]
MGERRRVYIVEDHPVFRLGLKELINQEQDLEVCGEAGEIAGALADIGKLRPDLVIVDLCLRGRSGLELIREIRARLDGVRVLVLSMYDEALYGERALLAGARGYIMKQEASECIVQAVRRVLEGKIFLSETLTGGILDKLAGGPACLDEAPLGRLTEREAEVLQLIGQGLTTCEIADRLSLSAKTIGTYRERIKEKLHLRSGAELVRYAVRCLEADQR